MTKWIKITRAFEWGCHESKVCCCKTVIWDPDRKSEKEHINFLNLVITDSRAIKGGWSNNVQVCWRYLVTSWMMTKGFGGLTGMEAKKSFSSRIACPHDNQHVNRLCSIDYSVNTDSFSLMTPNFRPHMTHTESYGSHMRLKEIWSVCVRTSNDKPCACLPLLTLIWLLSFSSWAPPDYAGWERERTSMPSSPCHRVHVTESTNNRNPSVGRSLQGLAKERPKVISQLKKASSLPAER